MATIKTDLICNLNQPVNVTYLHGNLFSQDNAGNTINVFVMDNGEPATIGGTVSANVIRSDGQTVAVSGAIEGNKAYVILPQACYAVPGVVHIIIKVTQNTTITTIAAIVANVYMSTTDAVIDPGTVIPSIQALMALIEEAVDSIPTDYTGLLHTIAADYSSSKTYKVGDYAWESGVLKRCIVPITAAETYTAAHWTNAVIGDDLTNLKSAISDENGNVILSRDIVSDISYLGDFGKRTVNGTYSIPFSTVSGHTYTVTNVGSVSVSIYLRETRTGTNVQTVSSGLASGKSITFKSNQNTAWISGWSASETTFTIVDISSRVEKYDKYANDITLLADGRYPLRLNTGGFISSEGTVTENQYYMYSDYIDCSAKNKIRVVSPVNKLQYCCWYSSDLSSVQAFSVPVGDTIVNMPSGFKYCRLSAPTNTIKDIIVYIEPFFSIKEVDDKTVENKRNILSLQDGYLISNDLNSAEWYQGSFSATEEENSSAYRVRSNYIYCGNLKGISCVVQSGYYVFWHTYDINKTAIEKRRTWTGNCVIPIEDNVAYIRIILDGDQTQVTPSDVSTLLSIYGFNKEGESIPEYWLSTLASKISTVLGLQKTCGNRGDEFVYITDYHDTRLGLYNCDISASMIERIMRKTSARFVVFGGDGFDHESTIGAYREGQYNFYDKFYFLKTGQFFPVIGNHEFYSDLYTGTEDDAMSSEEAYNINLKRYESSFIATDYLKSYCFDNAVQKIRYFVLGCNYNSEISDDQIAWLMERLLELPSGYSVFLITHSGTYVNQETQEGPIFNEFYQKILDGLDALKRGWDITINGVTYDFTDKQRDVICALSGHTHIDMDSETNEGIPVVVRAADKINVNRTKGTTNEQLFDVVNIDMTNRKVYFTRVGAGDSAVFDY